MAMDLDAFQEIKGHGQIREDHQIGGMGRLNDEKYDFVEGLKTLIRAMDCVTGVITGIKSRLESIDKRIDGLAKKVTELDQKTDSILKFTKVVEADISKCTNVNLTPTEALQGSQKGVHNGGPNLFPPEKNDCPLNTTLKMATSKSKGIDVSPKDVTTMIFDVSDDDDVEIIDIRNIVPKTNVHTGPIEDHDMGKKAVSMDRGKTKMETDPSMMQFNAPHSEYRRRPTKENSLEEKQPRSYINVKKLFQTPLPSSPPQTLKKPKLDKPPIVSTNDIGVSKGKQSTVKENNNLMKQTGIILPKMMKSHFRPTSDMHLTELECKISAYIFAYHYDDNEVLLKMGDFIGTRKDFSCLCPERVVEDEVITMACLKSTWKENHFSNQTIWYCPPTFALDVLNGASMMTLATKYVDKWMPTFQKLKYVYVPIKDEVGHWYLMVTSMEEQIIYHLDTTMEMEGERRKTIRRVSEALAELMASEDYPIDFLYGVIDVGNWEILTTAATPHYGNSYGSALCVLDWLDMSASFHTNLIPMVNERHVRMRIALNILCGEHNENKHLLEARAETYWWTCKMQNSS
ncbi:Ulp1 protease family, C-terminal catalytic domain [Sesbania bispinosa]|nr:Ulp1 protease family, C-terminal catalytic domain [Sesbania bispinosa]